MINQTARTAWRHDAEMLRELVAEWQHPSASVDAQIPQHIADHAVLAWQRPDPTGNPGDETPAQSRDRRAAGILALIGARIAEAGRTNVDGAVSVRLSSEVIEEAAATR